MKKDFSSIKNLIFKNYKGAAKRRGYVFELTHEQFLVIISSKCVYCGQDPHMTYRYGGPTSEVDYTQFKYNGVDRVDNLEGYTIKNSVSCCKICNNSKNILSTEEWLNWIKRVYNFNFENNVQRLS